MVSKLILPGQDEPEESALETFSTWLDKADMSVLDDDEIETLLRSVNKFGEKLSRNRKETDKRLLRRYENILYTIQSVALRMSGSDDHSIYDLRHEIDKIIKGAKLNERR